MDDCSVGAIQLVDQRAVIDNTLCTECQACIEACPNGAIIALAVPGLSAPIKELPVTALHRVSIQDQVILPGKAAPDRGLAPLAGAALAFLGSDVAPRLVDILITALERRSARPTTTAVTPLFTSSRVLTTQIRGKRKQARYRGGRIGNRNLKERR
jgi:hypothetical protein